MSDEPLYRPGRMVAGRYRITNALSQGGMGAVYLAQQVSLGRDVALKVILERGSDPELIARFDREARAVCQLKHPNIITYYDYGRDEGGHPFLVMEYLAGYPGTKLVYGEREPSIEDLVHVIGQVCLALDESHRQGIIHRDLKWSNVMICPTARDPYFAKLIDFGILKVATDGSSGDQRGLTRTGMLLGTPEYMSPEAICGLPIDGRADQYSLAIMLWEALEGRRPFDSHSQFELLRMQVQEPPPPLELGRHHLEHHPALALVLERALEKHPDDRFDTISAFYDALKTAIGEPGVVTARGRAGSSGRRAAALPANPPASAPVSLPGPAPARSSRGGEQAAVRSLRVEPRPVETHLGMREAARVSPLVLALAGVALAAVTALVVLFLTRPDGATNEAVDTASVAQVSGDTSPDAQGFTVVAMADATPSADAAASGPDEPIATEVVASSAEVRGPGPADVAIAMAVDTVPAVDAGPEDTRLAAVKDGSHPERDSRSPPRVTRDPAVSTARKPTNEQPPDRPEDKSQEPGRLIVIVDPWGFASIDGGPAQPTPLVRELRPGRYTVRVSEPDHFIGVHTFGVVIRGGDEVKRLVRLVDHLQKIAE